uniref:Ig-like domain-containing protein n=1 Tax=Cyprinus carpio TaxID=7962 RepID=A0A8C1MI09_CYPCA
MCVEKCVRIFLCPFCAYASQTLTESESVVIKPGNNHKLTCTFSGIDVGDADISWIRQAEGKALEWISQISAPSGSNKYYVKTVEG